MSKPVCMAVVGGGAWGTALAVHLARTGREVRLWMRDGELVARMAERRDNPVYLPGIRVPDSVLPVADIGAAVSGAAMVVTAVPSPFAREVYRRLAPVLGVAIPVVVTTKGVELETLALPLEVASAELGPRAVAILSGPSFALEVAQGHPTAVVVASADAGLSAAVQDVVSSRELRVYTNPDPLGVQLAGASKNVMAIAVGIADSLGMGTNALAGFITRGLAEMSRLILALGGRAETPSGLAGLGDLVLTCTGGLSRNRRLGQRLGGGERLEDILRGSRTVAEGLATTRSIRELARRASVEMPIVEEVYRILYDDGSPQEGLDRLLNRPLTSELEPAPERDSLK